MNLTLSKSQENYLVGIRKRAAKNLRGEFFDLQRTQVDHKEWKQFKQKVSEEAIALLSEINRIKKSTKRIDFGDVTTDTKGNDNQFFFDFYGINGSVRFTFNKGINSVINFDSVTETVYEDEITLF